ncbi:hypothetical protein [Parapedobacter koreensis]|uniref:Lipoprotein n=1 Tax=Parapedobacter koreensis TaxID=332977 RepID=A0A1H7TUA3_9SPHI|nr:hypothetical protein [Parapedobacter koreensis]SEL88460.1 hypothetical protein SAMN05421740_11298 [Parapedobacter koreensis]
MKKTTIALLYLLALNACAQQQEKFDPVRWKAPYDLSLEGWGIERFAMPIDFAPTIPFKGVEDIRFTPGWGNEQDPEYWSYAFLWYVEGTHRIQEEDIQKNLAAYFDGLVGRNIEKRSLPKDLVKETEAQFRKLPAAESGDLETFVGTVNMVDYMGKKPMVLQGTVHIRQCPDSDHTILFHQFSPQERTAPVWAKLNGLWEAFSCGAPTP